MYGRQPQQELRAGAERAWPSTSFYENLGLMPSTIDRYGQAQTALYSGVNNALLGMPHALMERFAPETAAKIDQVRTAHGDVDKVAGAAGFIASPASRVFRAGGDALRARGFGVGSQAAADAAVAGAVTAAPTAIAGNGLDDLADNAAAGAAGYRLMSPFAPANMATRAAVGAVGGLAMSGGDLVQMSPNAFTNAATGALLGAASKSDGRRLNTPNYMERGQANLARTGWALGPVVGGLGYSALAGQKKEFPEPTEKDAPGYGDRPADYWRAQMARALMQ